MSERLLLCSDLDRTLLPNGNQPESPEARPRLRRLAQRPELVLAYVSGRNIDLIEAAIEQYHLPHPDYALADVGTSIYRWKGGDWRLWESWRQKIGHDWRHYRNHDLRPLLDDIEELALQEETNQHDYKLSYYAMPDLVDSGVLLELRRRLRELHIDFEVVWSVDETSGTGLLDILPASATKLGAVRFLMRELDLGRHHTVFAGDSGNDLDVLASDIPGVLVANATDEVRQQSLREAEARNRAADLYCARGGFMDMNGNYSAGVLEGLVHFHPEVRSWIE
ncbi:MAG: haloacid dehalogenase [Gammaproteobacteria bacterium]|nr:haloacid dehalogenase [Gammaproteobacteria bacterium]